MPWSVASIKAMQIQVSITGTMGRNGIQNIKKWNFQNKTQTSFSFNILFHFFKKINVWKLKKKTVSTSTLYGAVCISDINIFVIFEVGGVSLAAFRAVQWLAVNTCTLDRKEPVCHLLVFWSVQWLSVHTCILDRKEPVCRLLFSDQCSDWLFTPVS